MVRKHFNSMKVANTENLATRLQLRPVLLTMMMGIEEALA